MFNKFTIKMESRDKLSRIPLFTCSSIRSVSIRVAILDFELILDTEPSLEVTRLDSYVYKAYSLPNHALHSKLSSNQILFQ